MKFMKFMKLMKLMTSFNNHLAIIYCIGLMTRLIAQQLIQ